MSLIDVIISLYNNNRCTMYLTCIVLSVFQFFREICTEKLSFNTGS